MHAAVAEKRIALVIGNGAYANVKALKNADSDASAVAASLQRLGFEVTEKHDLSLADLTKELKAFGDRAPSADWAVVYYAGHGIEVGGVNYLIPVDAELASATHVDDEAMPLDRVLAKVEGAKKLRLVILDACRENPFAVKMASAGTTRSVGRGLARIEPEAGVLVAYSAKDGQVAQDGDGTNSPFAESLLKYLDEPGLEINMLFRRVHDDVQDPHRRAADPLHLWRAAGRGPLFQGRAIAAQAAAWTGRGPWARSLTRPGTGSPILPKHRCFQGNARRAWRIRRALRGFSS